MKIPLQISSRKFVLTDRLIQLIKDKSSKLERFYGDIIACRVMVETPHRHKNQGILYNVRIDINVPGDELVVKREPHEDVYIAVRDAFDAARRQLLTYSRRRRPDAKSRGVVASVGSEHDMAQVASLFSEEGFGFLKSADGRQIYFSRNELLDSDFEDLEVGRLVRYSVADSDNPQVRAATVTPA